MKVTVEICCGSIDDVIQAKEAGADRVELNSSMFLGGITPSVGTMMAAKEVGIETMAMVRPREGGFCYTDAEFKTMLNDAAALLNAGADGIVFGILNGDGTIDEARCRTMVEHIGDAKCVFHRAIDVVPDWQKAMDTLMDLGFTRILTSGQAPSVHYGMDTIKKMIEYAHGRIQILPGAGITLGNAKEVVESTGCEQIHIAMTKSCVDSSTDGNEEIFFGGALYPPENRFAMTDKNKVSTLVNLMHS